MLVVMRCRECNDEGAYEGLLWIHCRNQKCRYYDATYAGKVKREEASSRFFDKVDKLSSLRKKSTGAHHTGF